MSAPRVALPPVFLDRPIAHRAFHNRDEGRPENSLAAIRAAVEAGYGIEIDIQPSSDGVPMVFHDYDLTRLVGREGAIRALTARKLQSLRLIGGDEGIPTLRQVLDTIAGRVPLLIEVKSQDEFTGDNTGPLEQAIAAELEGYAGPVAVMSFNPHSVAAMARHAPHIPRGLTTWSWGYDPDHPLPASRENELREIPDYDPTGSSFISHEADDLSRPRVAELKAQGAAILCWTIRSATAEATARQIADNVTFEGYRA